MERGYKNEAVSRRPNLASAGMGAVLCGTEAISITIKERADRCESMLNELINRMDNLRSRAGVHFPEPCGAEADAPKPDGLSRTIEGIESSLHVATRLMSDLERIA